MPNFPKKNYKEKLSSPLFGTIPQLNIGSNRIEVNETNVQLFTPMLQNSVHDHNVSLNAFPTSQISTLNAPQYLSPIAHTKRAISQPMANKFDLCREMNFKIPLYNATPPPPKYELCGFANHQYGVNLLDNEGVSRNKGSNTIVEPNNFVMHTQRAQSNQFNPDLNGIPISRHVVMLQNNLKEASRRLNDQSQTFMKREKDLLTIIDKLQQKVQVKDLEMQAIKNELLSTNVQMENMRHGQNLLQTFHNEDKHFFYDSLIKFFFSLEEAARKEYIAEELSFRFQFYFWISKAFTHKQNHIYPLSIFPDDNEECGQLVEHVSRHFRDLSNSCLRSPNGDDKILNASRPTESNQISVMYCESTPVASLANANNQLIQNLTEEKSLRTNLQDALHFFVLTEHFLCEKTERAVIEHDALTGYLSLMMTFFNMKLEHNTPSPYPYPMRTLRPFTHDIYQNNTEILRGIKTCNKKPIHVPVPIGGAVF
ncbi:unnamed protein product [Phytomonas sp. Hart1]|nr:unnamed protein product [Phytomonas sp. Hart1]|eukprot:CCW70853.1 unnamed protein product [Phytomonas sp. isolate Hart1]